MSQVPSVGEKQRLVGPGGGGGGGGSPATSAPPQVRASSVLGVVTTRYALEDHTHRSPVVFWADGDAQTDAIVANRATFITVTTNLQGVTNFCAYDPASTSPGAAGPLATIGGGYENGVQGTAGTVAGGQQNNILSTDGTDSYNAILGGRGNTIEDSSYAAVLGGFSNTVGAPAAPANYASILGGAYNEVRQNAGVALGMRALSYTRAQESFAAGSPDDSLAGAQASRVVLSGFTPGEMPRETVNLTTWAPDAQEITLLPDRTYVVVMEATAHRVGTNDLKVWAIGLAVRTDNVGNVTVVDQTEVYSYSGGSTVLYTLVASGVGTTLRVTFYVGTGNTHEVNVACQVRMTEVKSTTFVP